MSDPLLASVRDLIQREDLLPRGARVVVAVSGGQDSCALLHVLAALRPELDVTLHAAHLDHGFRGEEAAADAAFVAELAASLGVHCTVEREDVPAQARRLHLSAQVAARRARHAFLERVADAVGADRIALGHTRDDRVETVLLNILRGTGVDGLKGFTAHAGRRVRPLLEVARADTAAYCARHGVAFREDRSNRSLRYARNRVRAELLPEIESYYNPDARSALLRLATLAEEDSALLNALARAELERCHVNREPGRAVLSASALAGLPLALRRRALRMAIADVRGGLEDVEFAAVERVVAALAETPARPVGFTLPGARVRVRVTPGEVRLEEMEAARSAIPVEHTLPLSGEVAIPEWGLTVRAECAPAPAEPRFSTGDRQVWVAAEAVRPPLVVRSRQPGDRMTPIGAPGSRKLQDILTDRKLPAGGRDAVPLITDAEGILWAVGAALSERARIAVPGASAILLEVVEGNARP